MTACSMKSNKGFILGYKFGFNGRLNAQQVNVDSDGSGFFIYSIGFSEFVPAKKMNRYSFIESLETGHRMYNIKGSWVGGD